MFGQFTIKPLDSSAEAPSSPVRKSKTGSSLEMSKVGEKSCGQRKTRRGKSSSEIPFDLRRFTAERITERSFAGGASRGF